MPCAHKPRLCGDGGTTRLCVPETRIGSLRTAKAKRDLPLSSRHHLGESSPLVALGALLQGRWCKPCSRRRICGDSALSPIEEVPMHRIPLTVSSLLLGLLACRGEIVRADSPGDAGSLSPTAYPLSSPSDAAIRTSIEEALVKNRLVEPQSGDVQIRAVSGVVTLQGHVDHADAKERIYALALHTPGVTRVID